MKVSTITNIIDKYTFYKAKIRNDKDRLQWELMSSGETEKTVKLRKQIKQDEESLGKYLDSEI